MLIRLTLARWLRNWSVWVRSVLLIFVLILLTETVQASMLSRAEATRQLLQSTPIRCVLATRDGRTENVRIMNGLVYSFVQGGWKEYVSDFSSRTQTAAKLPDGTDALINGVTLPCYDELNALGEVPGISWDEGWDASVFDSHEKVCVAGSDVIAQAETVEGALMLTMTIDEITDSFRIVGCLSDPSALWCPFDTLYDWTINLTGERLSFILADNAQIDAFLASAAPTFTPNEDGVYPALVQLIVQDESYRSVEQASRRNELLLQIVEPLFTALTFAAGVLVSFLAIRTRKREIAILQSMGMEPLALILQGFIETAVPCLLIFPASALLSWRFSMAAALTGMYVLGALIPICIFTARPLIHQLHEGG